jgi:hypothetical protein
LGIPKQKAKFNKRKIQKELILEERRLFPVGNDMLFLADGGGSWL